LWWGLRRRRRCFSVGCFLSRVNAAERMTVRGGWSCPFRWTVYRLSFLTSSSSKLCYKRSLPPKAVEALV
jgi:hypothetical protein